MFYNFLSRFSIHTHKILNFEKNISRQNVSKKLYKEQLFAEKPKSAILASNSIGEKSQVDLKLRFPFGTWSRNNVAGCNKCMQSMRINRVLSGGGAPKAYSSFKWNARFCRASNYLPRTAAARCPLLGSQMLESGLPYPEAQRRCALTGCSCISCM